MPTIDVPGATSTDAHGINAWGQIVGDYTDGSGIQGFLLSGGSFRSECFVLRNAAYHLGDPHQ
jgi:hypothetical protein